MTLPEGFSINPNAADGKLACADTEAAFGTRSVSQCPEHAKVGTLTLDSAPCRGRSTARSTSASRSRATRYRLFLAASGFATHVKLAGTVRPDPRTGQVVVAFPDLPQSPLSEFDMHFFGAERGLLATPTRCGEYAVEERVRAVGRRPAEPVRDLFLQHHHRPQRDALPGHDAPLQPDGEGRDDRQHRG